MLPRLIPGRALSALLVLAVALALGVSIPACGQPEQPSPSAKQEKAVSTQAALASIRAHDRTVLARAEKAGPDFPDEVRKAMPALDGAAQELAVAAVAKHDGKGAGSMLLEATGSPNGQVAGAAARAILDASDPAPVADVLKAIPTREMEFARERLFLVAGACKDPTRIDDLRALALAEKSRRPSEAAQAAIVKLGGKPEREALLLRVRSTPPDRATEVRDQLLYIGDPSLAKGMLPWLSDQRGVFRLGSDRTPGQMVRMCDLAVWTAHLLGVKFPPQPEHLTNFDGALIARADSAIRALPD